MDPLISLLPDKILTHIEVLWTFWLVLTRYTAFFILVPGIGMGIGGMVVRMPAAIVFASVSVRPGHYAEIPSDMIMMASQLFSEVVVGALIGMIPLLVVSGAQAAGHMATTSMGLNGAQLFDPTANAAVPDLARIYGDLTTALFLVLGGHYGAIGLLAGLGETIAPGTFMISERTVGVIIDRSGHIFEVGIMLAAPVIVALLLTNFLMGLVSKAVPAVNIFVVSFPLTIGIGLILTMLAMPEAFAYLQRELASLDNAWLSALNR